MPSKRRPQARRGKQPRAVTQTRKRSTSSVPQRISRRKRTVFTRRGEELQSHNPRSPRESKQPTSGLDSENRVPRSEYTRSNLLRVASDMRRAVARGEKLTFSRAAKERGVDPRSRFNHLTKLFYKDASGRIHARKTDNYAQKFSIPTTRPDVFDTITARGNEERSIVGRWLNAMKAAADGDFTLINAFPKNVFVDGKRLPTAPYEVQRILEALEQSENAFEQQYYGRGAR